MEEAKTLVTDEYKKEVYDKCIEIVEGNGDLVDDIVWMRKDFKGVTWGSLDKGTKGNVKTHAWCKTYIANLERKKSSGGRRRTRVKHNSKRKGSKSRNNRKSRKYSKRY
jgi:hypothetical protein